MMMRKIMMKMGKIKMEMKSRVRQLMVVKTMVVGIQRKTATRKMPRKKAGRKRVVKGRRKRMVKGRRKKRTNKRRN